MAQSTQQEMSYGQALKGSRLSFFLAGVGFSSIGDGMLISTIPLVAIGIHGSMPIAFAVSLTAAAAYVSSVCLAIPFSLGRLRFPVKTSLIADCLLRGVTLAALGVAAAGGSLSIEVLIGALLVGSCLRSLSASGIRLAAISLVPSHGRYAVNGLLSTVRQFALYVAGPALGGLVAAVFSPEWALVIDGATFLPLLVATLVTLSSEPPAPAGPERTESGLKVLRTLPIAWRLLVIVFFYNLFYMPVEVALPLFVDGPLAGNGKALGIVWTLFGAGAIIGALATNHLRHVPQRPLLIGIVAGWGAAMIGLASAQSVLWASIAFFVAGVIYAPFTPVAYTYLHTFLSEEEAQPVITLWSTVSTLAAPLGLAAAGPLVYALGGRGSIFLSALVTLALSFVAWRIIGSQPSPDPRQPDGQTSE
ncbi:MFS transporter [Streptomyces sp. NPDC089919]|uniref:MFS transporter n=1 Tax=Streptomyces sp. NPDC089919 TaxID=3155188 RepID=UPI00343EC1BC